MKFTGILYVIGFLLFLYGFLAIVLGLVHIELAFLSWMDTWGVGIGYLLKLCMALIGIILVYSIKSLKQQDL